MTWAERVRAAWDNPALNWDLAQRISRGDKAELVSWLRYGDNRWDVFWTQTFRGKHSENAAMVRWQRFLAESNLLSIVRAHISVVEPHRTYPSHHVHALLSMKSEQCLTSFLQDWRGWKEKAWRELGKALILKCDERAPIAYVLKYVLKTTAQHAMRGQRSTAGTPENLWTLWTMENGSRNLPS